MLPVINILNRYKKFLIALFILVIITIGGFIAFDKYQQATKATLIITGAPEDLTMVIDGKEIKSPHKLYISEGEYSLLFKRSGFGDQKKYRNLVKGTSERINIALNPVTEDGFRYLQENKEAARRMEWVGGMIYNETSQKISEKYPLITRLPVTVNVARSGDFIIDYKSVDQTTEDQKVIIQISFYSDDQRDAAIEWIKNEGFNPNDYEILFHNKYTNTTYPR